MHQTRCNPEIVALQMSDRNFFHSPAWGRQRFFSFPRPLRSRNPLLPTLFCFLRIGTNWTLKEDCWMSHTRSRYFSVFWSRASSKLDSKHKVSSKSNTSCFRSFHTTKSGRRSVVAMWGGNVHGAWSGRSTMAWYPLGRLGETKEWMTSSTPSCSHFYIVFYPFQYGFPRIIMV